MTETIKEVKGVGRFGMWSRITKSWMRDSASRIITYDLMAEARAHLTTGAKSISEFPEHIAAEMDADGQPILSPSELEPPSWSKKHQAPF